jgi:membrane-associated phospholipid phosphatase
MAIFFLREKYLRSVNKTAFFLLLILISCICIYPQGKHEDYRLNSYFLSGMKDDFVEVLASPAEWNKNDILRFSVIIGGGLILYVLDEDIQTRVLDKRTESNENISRFISDFGHGLFIGGLALSLYAAGEIADNYSFRKTGLLCLESWLTAGAIALCIKTVMGRARPYTGKGPMVFNPFASGSGNHSFPSGHAVSVFAAASVIAGQTDNTLIDIFSYSMATAVALSRVYNNQHWVSDVFIGSALGYFVGKKICRLNRNNKNKGSEMSLSFSPVYQGITVSFRF